MKKLILITLLTLLAGCATQPRYIASSPAEQQAIDSCNYEMEMKFMNSSFGEYVILRPQLFKACLRAKGF